MSQTKKGSLLEALTNTFVGFLITLAFSPLINKTCGIKASYPQMALSTFCFTILSIARGYIIRRVSNYFQTRKEKICKLN